MQILYTTHSSVLFLHGTLFGSTLVSGARVWKEIERKDIES